MARSRRRTQSNPFLLFDGDRSLGWTITRRISLEAGERLILAGKARRVDDAGGVHVGYQLQQAGPVKDVPVRPSEMMLARREMELLAGRCFKHGRSRTAGMSEAQRLSRVHPRTGKLLPPEDAVERAEVKLKAFTPRDRQTQAA